MNGRNKLQNIIFFPLQFVSFYTTVAAPEDKTILAGISVLGVLVAGVCTFTPGSMIHFTETTQCGLFTCVGKYSSYSMNDILLLCDDPALFECVRWMFVFAFIIVLTSTISQVVTCITKYTCFVTSCHSMLSVMHSMSAVIVLAVWICCYFVIVKTPHGSPGWGFYLLWISISTEIGLAVVCLPYFEVFQEIEKKEVQSPDSETPMDQVV